MLKLKQSTFFIPALFFSFIVILIFISLIICSIFKLPIIIFSEVSNGDSTKKDVPFNFSQQSAKPVLYDVIIYPDIINKIFYGKMKVHFTTNDPTSSIKMHCGNMINITKISSQNYSRNNDFEEIDIILKEEVKGDFAIDFEYVSFLSTDNTGLYITYDTVSNTYGVATQFEATSARKAFPCVDTPSSRAKFSLSLFAPEGLIAIANTEPEIIETISDFSSSKLNWINDINETNGKLYKFHEIPALPPYLVAFAVGKWDVISNYTKRGVPVDVYTPIGQTKRGEFALKLACDSIDFFENYFNINYPLPRLQLVSIPDFAAGAMENWGLVTFRDVALLAIDKQSSMSALNTVAEVVVHENAHMWAGDLVSPKAWTDLWLNEGFATILPHICLEEIDNRFMPWSLFYHSVAQEAIEFDFSKFTHAIVPDTSSLDNIAGADAETLFDSISYSKGGVVLSMLRDLLGESTFRKCLCDYFSEYAYTSASTSDLIASFEKTSSQPLAGFVSQWAEVEGFPTVTVNIDEDLKLLHLTQERLTIDGDSSAIKWTIPLNIQSKPPNENQKSIFNIRMSDATYSLQLNESFNTVFIEINPGRRSMAIIDYCDRILDIFLSESGWKRLSNDARWMLIEDLKLLALAKRKDINYLIKAVYLGLSTNPEFNNDLNVQQSSLSVGSFLISYFPNLTSVFSKQLLFSKDDYLFNIEDSYTKSSLQESNVKLSKLSIMTFLCKNEEAISFLKELNFSTISAELVSPYLRLRGQTDYDFVLNVYQMTDNPQIKSAAVIGIGSTQDRYDEVFSQILSGIVKNHEIPTLLSSLKSNKKSRPKVAEFFMENYQKIYELFGSGFQFQTIIEIAFESVDDYLSLEKLYKFLSQHVSSEISSTVGRAHEQNKARIDLMLTSTHIDPNFYL